MDLLVANKANPANTQVMTVEAFGMNGGTDEFDVLDSSDSDTWSERMSALNKPSATTSTQSTADLINNAAKASGVIVGNSKVLEQPGKLEAVAVVSRSAAQQLLDSMVDDSAEKGDGDDLQNKLLSGADSIKIMTIEQLNVQEPNTVSGNTQTIGTGSPEQAERARQFQLDQANQGDQTVNGNVPPTNTTSAEKEQLDQTPKPQRAKRSDSGKAKGKKADQASTEEQRPELTSPETSTDSTQQAAEVNTNSNPE